MPFPAAILRLAYALVGLALVGCYSPYRYQPYNPYGSGIPMYNAQPIPMQPQFGPPVGSPTPVYPDSTGTFPPAGSTFPPSNGGTFNGGLQPTPDPGANTFPPSSGGSGSQTPYNGFDPSLPPPTGGGLVPNYGDPRSLPPSGRGNTFEGNTTPFGPDGATFQRDSSSESVGSVRYDRGLNSRELQLTAHQTSPPDSAAIVPVSQTPVAVAKQPNPYGYDAIGYTWLRGIVDFDEQLKAWVLIYNPAPGPRDTYKGQLTLIDNGQLQRLKCNEVVLVEGRVDANLRDPGTGKPQYRVQKLYGPLVPKS